MSIFPLTWYQSPQSFPFSFGRHTQSFIPSSYSQFLPLETTCFKQDWSKTKQMNKRNKTKNSKKKEKTILLLLYIFVQTACIFLLLYNQVKLHYKQNWTVCFFSHNKIYQWDLIRHFYCASFGWYCVAGETNGVCNYGTNCIITITVTADTANWTPLIK